MIIDISKLNQTNGGRNFSYNDRAEDALTNAICYYYDLQANGGTKGFAPGYDKIINNTKVEIKISSSSKIYLEIAKADNTPSGLLSSEADVYATVTPGKDKGAECMKVRLYNKELLKHWALHMLDNHPEKLKEYPADNMGPGSKGFMLDWNAVPDLYVLGFAYIKDASGHIIFDTHNVLGHDRHYAQSKIRDFIS
jgi:hypothetical protein